ncbi:MAG: SulA-like leucine-rich domain-containing protein [Oleispira sp.]|jgi:cell division inhibitor SulA
MRQLPLGIQSSELTLSSRHGRVDSNNSMSNNAGISEIILATDSALQPIYLLPLLSQMSLDKRWLMWLAEEPSINRQWASALGIDASLVLHINAEQECFHRVCCKALAAGTGHLIIEWPGQISSEQLKELEDAAIIGSSHALLIRRR